ncbi:diaminopimelate epimerase [Flavimarina sp. Hel_I_48]|uniref:diaminopimelate epimerase n=1 Tax=Flavimarina sp. Hel_I_48 TaxID=1392488 RepID=UPI0004DF3A93|nr:diaminopimelate epimerase [Flavimarina sp. Hel_I_48]
MPLPFYKYQGTGNDFIMIDNRMESFSKNDTKLVQKLCDRKFGIGADGLILLENHEELDFTMVYYNADGTSSMCGNGGRCVVAFAHQLGIIEKKAHFEAIDGPHEAFIKEGQVHLKMNDVNQIVERDNYIFINTGSPHHIEFRENLSALDVKKEGSEIRYSSLYGQAGSNINFVAQQGSEFNVRTYERGVEDETLSCGTGVTAVALAMHHLGKTDKNEVKINAEGGKLTISFHKSTTGYDSIYLIGAANFVFEGLWP